MGGWDFTNPAQPRVWTAGAQIREKFTGQKCQIVTVDENLYTSYNNYPEIVIDGTHSLRVRMGGKWDISISRVYTSNRQMP